MNQEKFDNIPLEIKKRMTYLEGRADLFETKVLKIELEGGSRTKDILVTSRDPGSANALLPVVKELAKRNDVQITAITDGRGEEIFEKNFKTKDITPKTMVLGADLAFDNPELILMDVSSSEKGIDTYAAATYPEVPKVLIEDYYSTAQKLLSRMKEGHLPFPEKICVIDKEAKEIILRSFPELNDRIEVTGQPAFDRFATENTENIYQEVREKLGIKPEDKLVSYMSTNDEIDKIMQMADALGGIENNFYFVFRRHPRDNVSYETYKKIFEDRGIKILDADDLSTDQVGAASDLVLTSWSIEGINAIHRRKPTVHIVDKNFRIPEGLELPLAPVRLGASVGANNMSELTNLLPQLLDPQSSLNESLRKNMESNYLVDGKNANRVLDVVDKIIK